MIWHSPCLSSCCQSDRGWVRLGYALLFDFCHLSLNLTRVESYSRARLARLTGDVPQVISLLKSGAVKLEVAKVAAEYVDADVNSKASQELMTQSEKDVCSAKCGNVRSAQSFSG
jgi:hypothetical protein